MRKYQTVSKQGPDYVETNAVNDQEKKKSL